MRCKCYCRNYQTQLPHRDVFISVCLSTNPVPVRSQIKLFSLTQRGESSAPFKVDRSEFGQTVLGDNLSHNARTLRVVVKISSCGNSYQRLGPVSPDKVAPSHELLPGHLIHDTIQRLHELT